MTLIYSLFTKLVDEMNEANYLVLADAIEDSGLENEAKRLRKWIGYKNILLKRMNTNRGFRHIDQLSTFLPRCNNALAFRLGRIKCKYLSKLVRNFADMQLLEKYSIPKVFSSSQSEGGKIQWEWFVRKCQLLQEFEYLDIDIMSSDEYELWQIEINQLTDTLYGLMASRYEDRSNSYFYRRIHDWLNIDSNMKLDDWTSWIMPLMMRVFRHADKTNDEIVDFMWTSWIMPLMMRVDKTNDEIVDFVFRMMTVFGDVVGFDELE